MANSYGKLSAEVYEIDKDIDRPYSDVDYYYERLKDVRGKILEPAAGNGRILIPLLEKGLDIEGFDFSEYMLALLKENCRKKGLDPKIYQLDMTNFSLDQIYEAVIVPIGSFLLLDELEKAMAALTCFYKHLENNGRLILDIFLPESFEKGFVGERIFTNAQNDLITLEEKLVKVDPIKQVITYHNRYEKYQEDKMTESELEIFPLKWYGVEEFRLLLEKVGFKDIVVSADHHFREYPQNNSQTITFEATKIIE
ncbi:MULTISPECIES: class I SAM-dependent DNA methyltransferase [unclassified Enterococcus]|uniref:class I SAM-dependent DNA methyltransferase n=1 Tax=unclassified Enterococcus TaxID=2608891 RepID=UPI001A9AA245|nr:class I SAM-dependent methyltransferase [Enterococcus sp. DIV1271a]MBO1301161.1 class I SAM-dependent methyltransferase [Enterococcus sp. DIV1271a]